MSKNINAIIAELDNYLILTGQQSIDPVEANAILAKAGLLNNSKGRPGKPLRDLLRKKLLSHAFQSGGKGSPWTIPHSSKLLSKTATADSVVVKNSLTVKDIKVFENDDRGYSKWVQKNPFGFVINTRKEKGHPYRVAHKVACRFINNESNRARSTANYIKACATHPFDFMRWFYENKTDFDGTFHECGKCKPNINSLITNKSFFFADEINTEGRFEEGAVKSVLVNRYERDIKARQACITHFGLRCAACNMHFLEKYGDLGKDFIHVHHKIQLSKIKREYKINPTTDLVPVCPNCHAMLHRRIPALTVEQLKEVLK